MPPRFPPHFQGTVLRIPSKTFFPSFTGLSPSMVFRSRKLQVGTKAVRKVHRTTSPPYYYDGFSLNCAVFGRSYSRHLLLISFPAGTQTFQSPAFPYPERVLLRSLIRTSLVLCLRSARQSISSIVTSFISVLSLVIHLAAS